MESSRKLLCFLLLASAVILLAAAAESDTNQFKDLEALEASLFSTVS